MIEFLHSLGEREAVGVLARAALSLDPAQNPAAQAVLENELELRRRLLAIARDRIGLSPEDDSDSAREKIGDFLDQEADTLVGPTDTKAALLRLAESGSLPSDLYEVEISQGPLEWLNNNRLDGRLEQDLIRATILFPDKEQHYGPSSSVGEPSLVSIFIKYFRTKWPFKDFYLLVAGARNGLSLSVAQAWRIYPSLIDISRCKNLVEVLMAFTDKYGSPVDWEGRTSAFFLSVGEPLPHNFAYKINTKPGQTRRVAISQIVQSRDGVPTAALVVCIDLIKYRDLLNQMQVSRADIVVDLPVKASIARAAS